jgi:hypothetical protein
MKFLIYGGMLQKVCRYTRYLGRSVLPISFSGFRVCAAFIESNTDSKFVSSSRGPIVHTLQNLTICIFVIALSRPTY